MAPFQKLCMWPVTQWKLSPSHNLKIISAINSLNVSSGYGVDEILFFLYKYGGPVIPILLLKLFTLSFWKQGLILIFEKRSIIILRYRSEYMINTKKLSAHKYYFSYLLDYGKICWWRTLQLFTDRKIYQWLSTWIS